jgi:hypothetical protein
MWAVKVIDEGEGKRARGRRAKRLDEHQNIKRN